MSFHEDEHLNSATIFLFYLMHLFDALISCTYLMHLFHALTCNTIFRTSQKTWQSYAEYIVPLHVLCQGCVLVQHTVGKHLLFLLCCSYAPEVSCMFVYSEWKELFIHGTCLLLHCLLLRVTIQKWCCR